MRLNILRRLDDAEEEKHGKANETLGEGCGGLDGAKCLESGMNVKISSNGWKINQGDKDMKRISEREMMMLGNWDATRDTDYLPKYKSIEMISFQCVCVFALLAVDWENLTKRQAHKPIAQTGRNGRKEWGQIPVASAKKSKKEIELMTAQT